MCIKELCSSLRKLKAVSELTKISDGILQNPIKIKTKFQHAD